MNWKTKICTILILSLISSGCVTVQTKHWLVCEEVGRTPAGLSFYSYADRCENDEEICYLFPQGVSCTPKTPTPVHWLPSSGTITIPLDPSTILNDTKL